MIISRTWTNDVHSDTYLRTERNVANNMILGYSIVKKIMKMMCKLILLFVVINLLSGVISHESQNFHTKTSDGEAFVPTHEWQIVKKGQPIPRGLHVRLNLQTGLQEAKLLDPDDANKAKSTALSEVAQTDKEAKEEPQIPVKENSKTRTEKVKEPAKEEKIPSPNPNTPKEEIIDTPKEEKIHTPEELKEVLKNIKSDDVSTQSDPESIKEKFRNYEELKKELDELNITVKSDAEVLKDLFKDFKETVANVNLDTESRDKKILEILENFEYMLHQIDNAEEFVNLNGFNEIIYKNLNSSNTQIKCETLKILGSCVQNNAKAQIHALETGAIDKLLRVFVLESDNDVKSRAIYSISSLLRRFPLAQKYFVKNGGLNALSVAFEKPGNMKAQMKIITMFYDLMMEDQDCRNDKTSPDYKEKIKQYKQVDLKNKLCQSGWCDIFGNVLVDNLAMEENDHDAIERCLNVMSLVNDLCTESYSKMSVVNALQKVYNTYEKLSLQEKVRETSIFQYLLSKEPDTTELSYYFDSLKDMAYDILKSIYEYKVEL